MTPISFGVLKPIKIKSMQTSFKKVLLSSVIALASLTLVHAEKEAVKDATKAKPETAPAAGAAAEVENTISGMLTKSADTTKKNPYSITVEGKEGKKPKAMSLPVNDKQATALGLDALVDKKVTAKVLEVTKEGKEGKKNTFIKKVVSVTAAQ